MVKISANIICFDDADDLGEFVKTARVGDASGWGICLEFMGD
jgi:hypothetical protein